MSDWTPCDHRPPLPRIVDAPYTPAPPDTVPAHVRQQIDQMEQMMRKKNGDRIWDCVVQSATGG